MKPKHTRGPWLQGRFSTTKTYVWGTDDNTPLCTVLLNPSVSLAEREANARLIACAPELVEALEWAVNMVAAEVALTDLGKTRLESARNILTKATGGVE